MRPSLSAQFRRRQVDQLDLIGKVEHRIRNGFGDPHAGDAGDRVVEAFQMLDVERGPDIDAGIQQLPHIEPALGVAQARGVGVGQFIDQQQRRFAGERRIEIELLELLAAIGNFQARQHFQPADFLDGAGAAMSFDQPGHHVQAGFPFMVGGDQHLPGFADAGCCAQKDFQPAAGLPVQIGEQRIGVWAEIAVHFKRE
jgi:hypothetical protein